MAVTSSLKIVLLSSAFSGLINCKPNDVISAFEPIKIDSFPALYNSNVNNFVIKNVAFGVFGANQVTVTLRNVPKTVQGSIEFKLDHPSLLASSTINVSVPKNGEYFNVSTQTKTKHGIHDLYIALPNGLHPSNIESIVYAPVQTPNEEQWYYIVGTDGQAMGVDVQMSASNIIISPYEDSIWNHFGFEKVRDNVYKIIARVSGEVLTVPGNDKTQVNVRTEPFKNEDGQMWRLNPTRYGSVYFHPIHDLTLTIGQYSSYKELVSSNKYKKDFKIFPICSE